MILLVMIVLAVETAITSTETLALTIAGFGLSWIMAALKRFAPNLNGALAHFLVLLFSALIALGAMWSQGQLHNLNDVVKSMSVIATAAVATYHFIVDQTGIEKKETA
jgi:hypothetical protein